MKLSVGIITYNEENRIGKQNRKNAGFRKGNS